MKITKRVDSLEKPKLLRKPNVKKPKTNTIINLESFQKEYDLKHSLSTLHGEISFIQNNGFNQRILKQFYEIQNENSEAGFISKSSTHDLQLNESFNKNFHNLFSTNHFYDFNDIDLKKIDINTFFSSIKLNKKLEFQFNNNDSTLLDSNNVLQFPYDESNLRNGIVFNTGGIPISMEWCPLTINNTKYLFVCVVDDDSNLSEFSNKSSSLMILEYNETERKFNLNKNILIDYLIKEMEFSFISTDDLTLLKLTLSNGTVEIWKIDSRFFLNNNNNYYYFKYTSGSKIFKISNELLKITSSTFASTNTLLIGTNRGFIGQFTIDTGKLDYLIPTRLPAITCIKSTWPTNEESNSIVAFISCSDFLNYLIKLPLPTTNNSCLMNNFKIIEISPNNKELQFDKNTIYLNNIKSFFTVDWPYTIRKITIDNPNNTTKFKISNDKEINCLNSQMNYSNGLLYSGFTLITGHTNGSIRLSNYLNMNSFVDKKQNASTIKIMQMNKSTLNENKYWLDLSYSVDKTGDPPAVKGKPKQLSISRPRPIRDVSPKEICPLKVSMIGKTISSIWGNGLIVIEDLII
jgi:hypothetical protein